MCLFSLHVERVRCYFRWATLWWRILLLGLEQTCWGWEVLEWLVFITLWLMKSLWKFFMGMKVIWCIWICMLHSIRAVRFHIYIWLFTGRIKRSTPGLLMIQIRCKRCCLSVWMLLLQAILLYFNVECKISEPNVSRKAFFCHDDIHLFQVQNIIPMTEPRLPLTRYIEVLNTFTDF